MEPIQETAIILRILGGEREAYALLVDSYKTQIFNLAYRMTGNYEDASDLAQEIFVRAYINLKKFQTDRSFFTWLYTISLNHIRNHLKKERLSGTIFFQGREPNLRLQDPDFLLKSGYVPQNPVLASCSPEQDILKSEIINKLARCLKSLPLDQRVAVVLRFYQGLSFAEIAAISGRSESAVKMRVYRGLERLRRLMGEIQSSVIKV